MPISTLLLFLPVLPCLFWNATGHKAIAKQDVLDDVCFIAFRQLLSPAHGRALLVHRCSTSLLPCATLRYVKRYIHSRLSKEDQAVLESLKKVTGESESDLVRRGLRLILKEYLPLRTALSLAGESAGKFRNGPKDLSTNKRHLSGFGK